MNGPLVDRLQLLPVEVGDDGFLFWYGGCLLVDSTDRLDQFQHLQKDDPTMPFDCNSFSSSLSLAVHHDILPASATSASTSNHLSHCYRLLQIKLRCTIIPALLRATSPTSAS